MSNTSMLCVRHISLTWCVHGIYDAFRFIFPDVEMEARHLEFLLKGKKSPFRHSEVAFCLSLTNGIAIYTLVLGMFSLSRFSSISREALFENPVLDNRVLIFICRMSSARSHMRQMTV